MPVATAPILPTQFRQGTATTSASVTLSSNPLVGSILVAACSVNTGSAASPSISGGGVSSWSLVGAQWLSVANQIANAMWVGVVGSVPATGITMSINGTGGGGGSGAVMELTNLTGTMTNNVINMRTGAGSTTVNFTSTFPRGVLVAMTTCFDGTLTQPGNLTVGVSNFSSREIFLLYGAAAYQANTPLALTATGTGAAGVAIQAALVR